MRGFLRAASGSERPMRLTLAGGGPSEEIAAQVERLAKQYSDKLRWVQSPDDEDLNKLYAASDFTVYPSYEEGFGLPILESLRSEERRVGKECVSSCRSGWSTVH